MADSSVVVSITAKDGTSGVFQKIGSSAKAAATDIEGIGKGATGLTKVDAAADKSAASLDKVGTSAGKAATGLEKTARSAADVERQYTAVGAAAGVLVAGLARIGQASATQVRQLDGLRRAYGDAADEIIAFTDAIQDSTVFSNEEAREAALIMSQLRREYGLTVDQIEELIQTSADLASIHDIGLADAAMRVSSAIRGETESAEFLGLALNQMAIDREGLTLTMTNQEAAQFRLNALNEQAAFAQGAAADAAQRTDGQVRQLANSIQDAAVGFGNFLGPVAASAAPLAEIAIAIPVVAAGMGRAVPAIRAATVALAAMNIALGPVGLVLALGVGAVAMVKWIEAAGGVAQAAQSLPAPLNEAAMAALRFGVAMDVAANKGIVAIDEMDVAGHDLIDLLAGTLPVGSQQFEDALRAWADAERDATSGANELFEAHGASMDVIVRESDALRDLNRAHAEGVNLYAEGIAGLRQTLALREALANAVSQEEADQRNAFRAIDERVTAENEAFQAYQQSIDGSTRYGAALQQQARLAYETARATGDHASAMDAARAAVDAYEQSSAQLANTLREAGGVNVLEFDDSQILQLSGSAEDLATALDKAGMGAAELFASLHDAPFLDVAADIEITGAALDDVLAKFEQLDALGQRSAAAEGIAANLIGEPGELAEIDNLLASGVITLAEYNEAVRAGTQIAQLDAAVQEDLNTIRARGLTELANQEAAYAGAIDTLAAMTSAQSELALSMLDTETQAAVAAAQTALYSAALGDIPTETATDVVLDIADANADAAAFLEQVGVIERLPDGSWAMAIDIAGGEEAEATVTTLNESIQSLQRTQIDIFLATQGDEEALARLHETRDALDDVDGRDVTATVALTSDRTSFDQDVAEIDGQVVGTATIQLAYAEPTQGPMTGEELRASGPVQPVETQTQAVTVEATVKLDTTAIDTYTPPTITVPAELKLDTTAIGNVTGANNPSGGAASPITVSATVELDTSELDSFSLPGELADFDGKSFRASVDITDGVSTIMASLFTLGETWDGFTYTAEALATDNASSVFETAQGTATTFATTYTATLAATDSASSTIGTVKTAADAVNATFTASLAASDGASTTIAAVSGALANLDGQTATVYVNVVQQGEVPASLPAGEAQFMHGGVVRPIPHAQHGRTVMVGEAGPELAHLPFGSMVQPAGASRSRLASGSGTSMVETLTAELAAGQAQAMAAGRELGEAAAAGINDAAQDFQTAVSEEYSDFELKRFRIPHGPKPLPADATPKQERIHERQTEVARERLDTNIGRAEEQLDAAPDEASRKQALAVLAQLLTKRNELDAAEARAEERAARAAAREEAAAKRAQANLTETTERATGAAEATGSIGEEAGVAAGAIAKLAATMETVRGAIGGLEDTDDELADVTQGSNQAANALGRLDKQDAEPTVGLDMEPFDDGVADVEDAGSELDQTTFTPSFGADRTLFDRISSDVQAKIDEITKDVIEPTVEADRAPFDTEMAKIEGGDYSVDVEVNYVDEQANDEEPPANLHGGAIRPAAYTAQHGRLIRAPSKSLAELVPMAANGRHVLVGEAGPELVRLPYGSYVNTNPASRSMLESGAVGPEMVAHFHGPVTFVVRDQDVMGAINRKIRTESRV